MYAWAIKDFIIYLQEADVCPDVAIKTLSRYQTVDQTFPVVTDHMAIMIPYPKIENGLLFAVSTSSTIVLYYKTNCFYYIILNHI